MNHDPVKCVYEGDQPQVCRCGCEECRVNCWNKTAVMKQAERENQQLLKQLEEKHGS